MTSYEEDKPLLDLLTRYWWLMACRGFVIALYGGLIFVRPYKTTLAFIILFTLYMLVSGLIALVLGFQSRTGPLRISAFLLPGAASVVIGLAVFTFPGLGVLALIGLVGAWCVLIGLTELLLAIQLRKVLRHNWALLLAGALSCLTGGSVLIRPIYIVFLDSWKVGTASLLLGTILIVLAIQMRHITDLKLPL
jgi:uncharacterized membrane protein HdeD (DUF308 family)